MTIIEILSKFSLIYTIIYIFLFSVIFFRLETQCRFIGKYSTHFSPQHPAVHGVFVNPTLPKPKNRVSRKALPVIVYSKRAFFFFFLDECKYFLGFLCALFWGTSFFLDLLSPGLAQLIALLLGDENDWLILLLLLLLIGWIFLWTCEESIEQATRYLSLTNLTDLKDLKDLWAAFQGFRTCVRFWSISFFFVTELILDYLLFYI